MQIRGDVVMRSESRSCRRWSGQCVDARRADCLSAASLTVTATTYATSRLIMAPIPKVAHVAEHLPQKLEDAFGMGESEILQSSLSPLVSMRPEIMLTTVGSVSVVT